MRAVRRRQANYAYPKYTLRVIFPLIPEVEATFMEALMLQLPEKIKEVESLRLAKHKDMAVATLQIKDIHPRRVKDTINKAIGVFIALGEMEDWYPEVVDIELL